MGSRLGEQGAGTAGGAVAGSGEGVVLACGKGRQAKAGKEATDRVIHHEAPTLYLWSLMYHGPTVVIVFYISVGQLQVQGHRKRSSRCCSNCSKRSRGMDPSVWIKKIQKWLYERPPTSIFWQRSGEHGTLAGIEG